jgi:hypothetical protein
MKITNAQRSKIECKRIQRELRSGHAQGFQLRFGAPTEIVRTASPAPKASPMNRRLAAAPAPTQTPVPADIPGALKKIVSALGLPPDADTPTIIAAVDALVRAAGGSTDDDGNGNGAAEAQAASFLTAKQRQICKETGCSPRKFIAATLRAGVGSARRV